jgi:hypothetical protein
MDGRDRIDEMDWMDECGGGGRMMTRPAAAGDLCPKLF